MAKHVQGVTAYTATGNTLSVASGRISYTFGLQGPALTVDTACSSSLVSLHTAYNSLLLRQCTRAVNAGANMMLSVDTPAAFAKSGMLSAEGRCKTLDVAADGYVRAEAAGAYMLQPVVRDAVASLGENAVAVLGATAINQDGRSSSLTAPNGPAQQEVIRASLVSGGISPSNMSGVELHGTGTGLGDPIEIGALGAVMESRSAEAGPLALLAGKSLMGHSEPAAGVMGIAHAQLSVAAAASLPLLHLHAVNVYVAPVIRSPGWTLPRQPGALAAAHKDGTATVGVSSFAFQGTNAHALVSAAPFSLMQSAPETSAAVWKRTRYWVHPMMYDIVSRVTSGGGNASFDSHFGAAKLAKLVGGIEHWGTHVLGLGTVVALSNATVSQLSSFGTRLLRNLSISPVQTSLVLVMRCLVDGRNGVLDFVCFSGPSSIRLGSAEITVVNTAGTEICMENNGSFASVLLPQTIYKPREYASIHAPQIDVAIASSAAFESAAALLCVDGLALAVRAVQATHSGGAPDTTSMQFTTGSEGAFSLFNSYSGMSLEAVDIATSSAAREAWRPTVTTSMEATAGVDQQPEGILYEMVWGARCPSHSTGHTILGDTVLSSVLGTHADALAVLQSGVANTGSIVAEAMSTLLPINTPSPHHICPGSAGLQGLLKALSQEIPTLEVGVQCMDPSVGQSWKIGFGVGPLVQQLDVYGTAAISGTEFVPRLLPTAVDKASKPAFEILNGLQMVTGGSGVLASHIANWLLAYGAPGVVLSSRSGVIPQAVIDSVGSCSDDSTLSIRAVKADSSFQSDLVALMEADVKVSYHAGGVLADATIANQSISGLRQVRTLSESPSFSDILSYI